MSQKFQIALSYFCISILAFLLAACQPRPYDVCSVNSPVYQQLRDNYSLWSRGESRNISIDGRIYVVRLQEFTSDNEPIIFIATNEGTPRETLGLAGYFYTPKGEPLSLLNDEYFLITQLDDNIYCYQRTR
jgi:hypothetical protein